MIVAIIPARGGSKRIPKKNIKNFCGKPIIAYSISAALNSGCFDDVIVSTDDDEIAGIAKSYGASVPFMRPKNIADDFTGTNAVIKQVIEQFETENIKIEYACCIYATAPFLKPKYINEGFERIVQGEFEFSFSVTTFPFPVQRSIRMNNESIEPLWPKCIKKRSQDLEEAYHDAGQFYWGTRRAFIDELDLFSNVSAAVVLPRYLVQDIDNTEDWKQAELMFKAQSIC